MKKIIISVICAAGAFILASCNQKIEEPTPAVKMVPVSFEASFPETKATLDGVNVVWQSGDEILLGPMSGIGIGAVVIGTNAEANVFKLTTTGSGASATFTGYLPDDLTSTGYALYGVPGLYQLYYASQRISPRWVSETTQTGIKDGVAANTIMMFAFSNGDDRSDIDFAGGKIHFHIGSALIKVGVVGTNIKKITLSTSAATHTSNNFLGGNTMNYNIRTGGCSIVNKNDAIQSIDLVPEGATFEPGNYYFAIPAPNRTIEGQSVAATTIASLKISYTKTDDSVVSKTSANTLSREAGKIYKTGIDDKKCDPE